MKVPASSAALHVQVIAEMSQILVRIVGVLEGHCTSFPGQARHDHVQVRDDVVGEIIVCIVHVVGSWARLVTISPAEI